MKVFIGPFPDDYNDDREIEVEIHDYDMWNLDMTLATIILPSLKKFREECEDGGKMTGHPCLGYEKHNNCIVCDCENQWNQILDKMIFSFEEILDKDEGYHYFKNDDYEGYREYQEKIQEGLNLFGKYFRSLWD